MCLAFIISCSYSIITGNPYCLILSFSFKYEEIHTHLSMRKFILNTYAYSSKNLDYGSLPSYSEPCHNCPMECSPVLCRLDATERARVRRAAPLRAHHPRSSLLPSIYICSYSFNFGNFLKDVVLSPIIWFSFAFP